MFLGPKLLATSLASLCLLGCGDGTTGSAFATIVTAASQGQFSYSFSYSAPPPEGRRLEAVFVDKVDAPCRMFTSSRVPEDFDALKVSLVGSTWGSYQVVNGGNAEAPGTANVVWIRNRKGVADKAFAVSGTVTYLSGPTSEAEWKNERTARMEAVVSFDIDPVVATECSGGFDMKLGTETGSCTCRRLGGTTFQCDTTTTQGECCHDAIGEMREYSFSVAASACPEQCTFTQPELVGFCRALLVRSGVMRRKPAAA